jgi:hypothetical protein
MAANPAVFILNLFPKLCGFRTALFFPASKGRNLVSAALLSLPSFFTSSILPVFDLAGFRLSGKFFFALQYNHQRGDKRPARVYSGAIARGLRTAPGGNGIH